MTFLPIADRELRVAARRRFTYWSRVVGAAFILLIFGMLLMVVQLNNGMGFSPGQIMFSVLKWIAFLFACSAGIFLTSDSISEEKREGTLGLLFLTDLRGHDVVLGKLLSQSLLAFYCLLAAFPILALPLLMGGVTGAEFSRAMLVICNTLFLSLAAGMFVSSISRQVLKAMNGTLLICLLLTIGLPWVDFGLAGWNPTRFHRIFSIASPGHLFFDESGLRPSDFWFEFLVQHAIAWGFLAVSSLCAPRAWQEKTVSAKGWRGGLTGWWRFGSQRARLARRRKLLPKNPILWVALRDRWMPRLVSLVMALATVFIGWKLYVHWYSGNNNNFANSPILALLSLVFLLWVGAQSCRLFVDSVRNGAMELILVTPLPQWQIINGQLAALRRIFLVPAILLLLLQLTNELATMRLFARGYSAGPPAGVGNNFLYDMEIQQVVSAISSLVTMIGTLMAMAWFGMWMGLTSKKTSIAVLKTLCFVCILPWFVSLFVQFTAMAFIGMATIGSKSGSWPIWISTLLAGVFELAKNIFFILWSRHKLRGDLREMMAQGSRRSAPRLALPPLARAAGGSSPTSP